MRDQFTTSHVKIYKPSFSVTSLLEYILGKYTLWGDRSLSGLRQELCNRTKEKKTEPVVEVDSTRKFSFWDFEMEDLVIRFHLKHYET